MTTTSIARSDEWLAERRSGLGGSDVAAALGLSTYKTPYRLWQEKIGEVEPEDLSDVERVTFGVRFEDAIAEEYMQRTGRTVHRVNRILRHPDHPWMLANLDRRVVGEKRGLEIKTVGEFAYRMGEWGDGGDLVPTPYLLQCQHYMAVTGYEAFDVAALVGGQALKLYELKRDEELIEKLITLESAFMRCVETKTPPDVSSVEDAKARFPLSVASPIEATIDIAEDHRELLALRARAKDLDGEIEVLKGRICAYMGECDTLTYRGETLATWKLGKPRAAYTVKEAPASRRLLIKGE